MKQADRITVVLAADSNYSKQLTTLIKSICLYNENVKFYLLNRDFSAKWFDEINSQLLKINSYITDIKCNNTKIKKYRTLKHIGSEAAYYRYFISKFIPEDIVLYLDSDIIVNGDLRSFFNIDISNYYLAAITDHIAEIIYNISKDYFNSGVLLINNKRWRTEKIHRTLIKYSEEFVDIVPNGDQDILNMVFSQKYIRLNRFFNYQLGGDYVFPKWNKTEFIENLGDTLPLILHFNSPAKPWLDNYPTRFRELYQYYADLDWVDVIKHRESNR